MEVRWKQLIFVSESIIKIMGYVKISAKAFTVKLKCAIHSTGKLGFTDATAKHMKLTSDSYIQFAQDEDDESILYLIHSKEENDDAFKIVKAGDYFYLNTKTMFDVFNYDYIKYSYIFDMVEIKDSEEEVYKLNMRRTLRKQK